MQTSTTTITTTSTANTSAPALPKARFNWIFSADKFSSTPSNRDAISSEEELALRQQAAVFIYELGTNLKVYVSYLLCSGIVKRILFKYFKAALLYQYSCCLYASFLYD
jgi:hypothetical protein